MTEIDQPIIVLVTPQLGENIGMAARAMLNCGLKHLRLVAPRDGWPSEKAVSASAEALVLMPEVQVYPDTKAAIADCQYVYATSGRPRHMVKAIHTADAAAVEMKGRVKAGERVAILFGAERTGLLNEDLMLATSIINVPTNPEFASLNISQAVLLVAYEWLRVNDETPARRYDNYDSRPATHAEYQGFIDRLEENLAKMGFFQAPDLRPTMMRNIQNTLRRAEMSEQDIRTFHGIISVLTGAKLPK